MRWAIDSLVAIMIAGIVAGVVLNMRQEDQHSVDKDVVRADVKRFQDQVTIQAAIGQVEMTDQGWPAIVHPEWFKADDGGMPKNTLLGQQHPWLEIAGPGQADLVHPEDRVAADRRTAKYWYNPYTGTVRARVPSGISDAETLALYNYVNGCNLDSLFASGSVFDQPEE